MVNPSSLNIFSYLKHILVFFKHPKKSYDSWPIVSDTSKFILFIVLIIADLVIQLIWYLGLLKLSQPSGLFRYSAELNAIINRLVIQDMAILDVSMITFSILSIYVASRIPEKSIIWTVYQGIYILIYFIYCCFFAMGIGENTSVIGITILSAIGFGIVLLKWRLILVACIITMVTYLFFVICHYMPWMHTLPSFYASADVDKHWIWALSYSWLVIPKLCLTLFTIVQILRLFKTQRQKIYELLEVDALTNIANRRHIYCFFEYLWKRKKYWSNLSVIYIDLDNFKTINDNFGHDAGDATLINAAQTISDFSDKTYKVGRLSGEEFIIILPEVAIETAALYAEQIRVQLANKVVKFGVFDEEIRFTASFGVACLNQNIANYTPLNIRENSFENYMRGNMKTIPSLPPPIEQLLKIADMVMQRAKKNGRNRVEVGKPFVLKSN